MGDLGKVSSCNHSSSVMLDSLVKWSAPSGRAVGPDGFFLCVK